jgi:triosephosphate isomerase
MTRPRPAIGTSWKMNLVPSAARKWFATVLPLVAGIDDRDLFVLPPFPALWVAREMLNGTAIRWGAQDIHEADRGAHTGDVSGPMLADLGCTYAEIGHSERRRDHGETDARVAAKVGAALRWNLLPIVCIGEPTRVASRVARAIVTRRLVGGLGHLGADDLARVIVAYEPAWAIGEGAEAAPVRHIGEMHGHIHEWLASHGAPEARVIYGGSVDALNAGAILGAPGVDGLFVGRAALDPASFAAIARTPTPRTSR